MAGIGFELKELARSASLSTRLIAAAHAIWIAAGPSILASASLLLVGSIVAGSMIPIQFQVFRIIVIYAFFLSMLASAPAAMVGARLAADAIFAGETDTVRAHFLGAFLVAGALCCIAAVAVFVPLASMPPGYVLLAISLSIATSWLWTAIVFAVALRDYSAIALAFAAGVGAIVGLAFVLARSEVTPPALLLVVIAGVLVSALLITSRFLAFFDGILTSPWQATASLISGMVRFPALVIGAIAAAAGVWIDKWVVWGSKLGAATDTGLPHAPLYDHAMLISFLAMLPLLAQFAVHVETRLYVEIRRFVGRIMGHATLLEIEASAAGLAAMIRRDLCRLIIVQLGISLVIIMLLPSIIEAASLQYRQLPIIRIGLLATVFHLCLIVCSSILLYTDSRISFLAVNVGFLTLNGLLTALLLDQDAQFAGYGYFFASLICGLGALLRLDWVLGHFPELLFARSLKDANRHLSATPASRSP